MTVVAIKEEGNKLFSSGNYKAALNKYTEALKNNPTDSEKAVLLKNRAACHLKLSNWHDVISDATSALDLLPHDPKALFRRCQAYEQLGEWKEAMHDVRKLIQLQPRDQAVHEMARRLNGKIDSIKQQQNSTTNLVEEMLSSLESPATDHETCIKAAKNLCVLAADTGGADLLLEAENLNRFGNILDVNKDDINTILWSAFSKLVDQNELLSQKVIMSLSLPRVVQALAKENEALSNSVANFCQTVLDAMLGRDPAAPVDLLNFKKDNSKFKPLLEYLLQLITDSKVSAVGRDHCIVLIMRNFFRRNGACLTLTVIQSGIIVKLLKLACKDLPVKTTTNTGMTVALFLNKLYDDLQSDQERLTFKEYCESYVHHLFEARDDDTLCKGMIALSTLLQGPSEVGTGLVSSSGALSIMVEMAKSSDISMQKIALDCIIDSSNKSASCMSLLKDGSSALETLFNSKEESIRARALVGLCKAASSGGADASMKPLNSEHMLGLADECMYFILAKDPTLRKCGIEAISYLSLDADIKQDICSNKDVLTALFDVAKTSDQSVMYAVAHILVNLTNSYDKPDPNPEMEKLAKFAKHHVPEAHPLDSEECVKQRVAVLVNFGVAAALVDCHKSQSQSVRESFSRVYLALSVEKRQCGILVQQGAVKPLLSLANEGNRVGRLIAAQALARITIRINPEQAFPGQRILEVIRPLVSLLHVDCKALQNFEALMGLTNLCHVSNTVINKIVKDKHFAKIEQHMYEEHEQIRLAAVQCMVNLLHSEEVITKFKGENERIKLLTLFCGELYEDDDDVELPLAASGALAILSEDEEICHKIVEITKFLEIFQEISLNPNLELVYRALYIISNIVEVCTDTAALICDSEFLEIFIAYSKRVRESNDKIVDKANEILKKFEQQKLIKAA